MFKIFLLDDQEKASQDVTTIGDMEAAMDAERKRVDELQVDNVDSFIWLVVY